MGYLAGPGFGASDEPERRGAAQLRSAIGPPAGDDQFETLTSRGPPALPFHGGICISLSGVGAHGELTRSLRWHEMEGWDALRRASTGRRQAVTGLSLSADRPDVPGTLAPGTLPSHWKIVVPRSKSPRNQDDAAATVAAKMR